MSTTPSAPASAGLSAAQPAGLTDAQVERSRRDHGANLLTPPARDPWWVQFLSKFEDPVIRILMVAAVVAIAAGAVHGEYAEGLGIIAAILLATALAFVNEYRAAREFDILNKVSDDVPVTASRNGVFVKVAKRDLVVGDTVLVEVGDEIPADGRITRATALEIDESKLTGESVPAAKTESPEPADAAAGAGDAGGAGHGTAYPADRALRGTMVAEGHGTLELTAVGDATEIGKTARAASEESDVETPLNQQLGRLSKMIGVVGLGVATLIFVALVARGAVGGELALAGPQWAFFALCVAALAVITARVWLPMVYDGLELAGTGATPPRWLETGGVAGWLANAALGLALFGVGLAVLVGASILPAAPGAWMPGGVANKLLGFFMISVTIIVVAVPEGLAMSVTLSLAYSMRKMTASNNLVRRMHACETIGAATVICSDKTGTLTRNEMRVREMVVGTGRPRPADGPDGGATDPAVAALLAEGIAVNSTANLGRAPDGKTAVPMGNVTEGALLSWLHGAGHDYLAEREGFATEYQWTFASDKKFMATLGRGRQVGAGRTVHVKGAPETVLTRCTAVHGAGSDGPGGAGPLTDEGRAAIAADLKAFQSRGMRTLGLASAQLDASHGEADAESLDTMTAGLTWLAFAVIEDPVRDEVPGAVKACRLAGIEVKIVTGDTAETAGEIARKIHLETDGHGAFMTGDAFMAKDDAEAGELVGGLKVLSRARPTDKLRLVRLLQKRGEVVAVTGDGTNDAPALNHADVGLSMGKSGTSVAKEASDIILLDDSFQSIVNAVMWGRSLYRNIQKFILFQLTINVAALGIALLGPFIGVQMPLTVIQMLWVNLIMDTFAALALATEPPSWDVMKVPPRGRQDFIVSPDMARSIFATAAVFLALFVAMLVAAQADGKVTPRELSIFFSVFVLLQFWNLFNARSLGTNTSALKGLGQNRSFLLIAGAILIGQVLIAQFGGTLFRTEPLSAADWFVMLASTSLVLVFGEAARAIGRAREAAGPVPAPAPAA